MEHVTKSGQEPQLDTSSNTEEEVAALDLAFPVFRQLDFEHFFPGGWTSLTTGLGGKAVFVGRGREQRYAGDKMLEGGRYWSVCNDHKGFDHSTLLNELRAYHGYMSRSEIYILDTTCDRESLASLHKQNVIDLRIVYNIAQQQFGNIDRPFLLLMIKAIQQGEKAKAAKLLPGRTYVFLYGLRVAEQRIEKLFDLRRAACRRWLLEKFLPLELDEGKRRRAKNNVVVYTGKAPPSTVEELFPILLSPEIGGSNPFIQALGSWLRCHGCNGIVFPSARSDFSATDHRGALESFEGWNFVDFRGAPPAPWQERIGHIMSFNTYLGDFFSIACSEAGDFADIRVKGLLKPTLSNPSRERCAKDGTALPHTDAGRGSARPCVLRCAHAPAPVPVPARGAGLPTAGTPTVRVATAGGGCCGAAPSGRGGPRAGAIGGVPPRRPARRAASPASARGDGRAL
jgi:hypothetical protein